MSISTTRLKPSLRASIAVQWRVIIALMIREAQSKYSTKTLGFFWTIAEPLILTCGVIVLWTVTMRDKGHTGVSVIVMAITAYTHLQLWRRTVLPAINILRRDWWLFYHRNVHVLDMVIAQTLMESVSIFTSFVIIMTVCVLFGIIEPVRDPGLILAAWGLDAFWCFSFSVFIAGLSGLSEMVEKLLHPLMYLTLPVTGAFSLTAWVPPPYRPVLEWIALADCCEMFRAGVFSLSVKTYWSVPVIVSESLFFLVIGLPILEYARRQLRTAI